MNGFQQQTRTCIQVQIMQRCLSASLTYVAVCLGMCLFSGCAMTQSAWKNVHAATCGEPMSHCHCSCMECSADANVETEDVEQHSHNQPFPAANQVHATTPLPPEASRPVAHGPRPQAATMNGMPGTWIPSPQLPAPVEFEDQIAIPAHIPTADELIPEPYANRAAPQLHIPSEQTKWPVTQAPAMCPPDATPQHDALKEYRTQVQVLSEQIAQMKNSQESIKANQETLKESHAREILELKLQQATADRDRLQRERQLEQQLEKQRQRELETIDSLSQIVEGVMPRSAPGATLVPVPQSATQTQQGQVNAPQRLPTVDENL